MRRKIRRSIKSFWRALMDALPAKWHVAIDHFRYYGGFPNLRYPKTFSEKTAYRKLYDRDPKMPPMVDKIASKELMAARFGASFAIPTLALLSRSKLEGISVNWAGGWSAV
jgi:hypothetical protein